VRIAEIIANPDSIASPAPLISDQLHTGHVDYSQPELIENLTTSPSTNEARVMKEWNTSEGRWDMRYLIAGDGIEIEEQASTIEVRVASGYAPSHPWKVVANGDDTVSVAAGNILSYLNDESTADQPIPSYINLKKFGEYAGGNVTVTGAGVIYGQVSIIDGDIASINYPSSSEIAQIDLIRHIPDGTIGVFYAATLPVSGENFNFEIAEVSLVAGDAVVDSQTITHNPTLHSFKIASTGA
jgi:hypothetical protein